MGTKSYLIVTGVIFGVIAVVHLLRLIYGWPAQIGEWTMPLWLSWVGVLIAGALCAWSIYLVRKGKGATAPR
jgi:branched-subunit amino acid transport protein